MTTPVRLVAVFAGAAALLPSAYGSIINGSELAFSTTVSQSGTSVNFACNQLGDSACATASAGTGDFAVVGSTDTFSQYNNTFGLIKSFNNTLQPLNTLFSLPNFITFDLNNSETIELTFIPLGSDPASTDCAGLTLCTPQNNLLSTPSNPGGLSAFNLNATQSGTTILFGVTGIVHDISGQTGTLSGLFTAQTTVNPQQTWAQMLGGGEVFSAALTVNSVSGDVPEPATAWLIGLALMGLVVARKRIAT